MDRFSFPVVQAVNVPQAPQVLYRTEFGLRWWGRPWRTLQTVVKK
jgi:hypothetical protein